MEALMLACVGARCAVNGTDEPPIDQSGTAAEYSNRDDDQRQQTILPNDPSTKRLSATQVRAVRIEGVRAVRPAASQGHLGGEAHLAGRISGRGARRSPVVGLGQGRGLR